MTNNMAQSKNRCFFEMIQEESLQQHSFGQDDSIRNAEAFQQVEISVTLLKNYSSEDFDRADLIRQFFSAD